MEIDAEMVSKKLNTSTASNSTISIYPVNGRPIGRRSRSSRPRETEEEAAIRRLHDAQRMARFRARKKKALEDQQQQQQQLQQQQQVTQVDVKNVTARQRYNGRDDSEPESSSSRVEGGTMGVDTESKYLQLLALIERIGRDVRLSYAGSRSSAERLKSGIIRARSLVRDCILETSLNLRHG